jgi:hypothetical protein
MEEVQFKELIHQMVIITTHHINTYLANQQKQPVMLMHIIYRIMELRLIFLLHNHVAQKNVLV